MWLSVWCEVHIVCIWSSWCHCVPEPHHFLPHLNPDWYGLTQVVLEKRPLNRGSSSSSIGHIKFLLHYCGHFYEKASKWLWKITYCNYDWCITDAYSLICCSYIFTTNMCVWNALSYFLLVILYFFVLAPFVRCCCLETESKNQATAGIWPVTWWHGFCGYKLRFGGKVRSYP